MNSNNISDLSTIAVEFQQYKKLSLRQKIWRSIFISSLAGGLCWGFVVPKWEIADSSQIAIEGRQYLDKETIVSLLGLSYPESIWQVQTGKMRQNLMSLPPVAEVKVTRQLFPPTIKIVLSEKVPVAVSPSPIASNSSLSQGQQQSGFLDRNGDWLPQKFYTKTTAKLPNLQIKGYRQQDRSHWQKLYRAIEISPLKFLAVDWRDSNNLVVYTQLGKVYLGTINNSNDISNKLGVLENMGELSKQVRLDRLDYIDLTDLKSPKIKEIIKPTKEQK
jgi:cell division protein FtsQ